MTIANGQGPEDAGINFERRGVIGVAERDARVSRQQLLDVLVLTADGEPHAHHNPRRHDPKHQEDVQQRDTHGGTVAALGL